MTLMRVEYSFRAKEGNNNNKLPMLHKCFIVTSEFMTPLIKYYMWWDAPEGRMAGRCWYRHFD